ncbi:dipeptidase PepV [Effusibacillus consociatus]|uniref:Dipeptidase PepV n=1 Tax=Effusibacillus consociatus TaxID=1117041 RepID=A0ABV9Q483_9BACL
MFGSWIQSHRQQIIGCLQELLRIPSVGEESCDPNKPFGEETDRALQYMLNLGVSHGCKVRNVDGYAGHIEIGDSDEYVAVLAHLDVVPAGTGWTYPPFGAEIHEGKIFARGAIDDKGPAMAAFYGLLAVKASGLPLRKKVRLILGIDEETDWRCMDHYFRKEPLPWGGFTPDADFPLIYAEKGILHFALSKPRDSVHGINLYPVEIIGGDRPNMVPDSCRATLIVSSQYIPVFQTTLERFCNEHGISYTLSEQGETKFALTVEGKSAHGSLPELGVNAITLMGKILSQFPSAESAFFEFLSSADPEGSFLGIQCSDEITGKLSCNLGLLEVNENSVRMVFDVRYPIDRTGEELVQLVQQTVRQFSFQLDVLNDKKPLYVPKDSPVVTTLQRVYEKLAHQSSVPLAIGGGTYARAIPNAVAFGPLFPGMEDLAHQKDECIDIEHLIQITNLYANAIYELAK